MMVQKSTCVTLRETKKERCALNYLNNEPTPSLTERLGQYAASDAYPFHMPGHKRRPGALGGALPEALDITEIDGFDDLHDPEGVLAEAMERAARLYGSKKARFLVNGSTCGILAGIHAAAPRGSTVLVARNCHKSVYHAIELLDLRPVYLAPRLDVRSGVAGSIDPAEVETALAAHPDAKLVVITSPTYEGVMSELSGIALRCRRAGVPLLVDEAHGAHFGLRGGFAASATGCADLVVQSLHKTLPSPTQTALLHWNSDLIPFEAVEHGLDIFETSSPSYPLMAAMDHCLRLLEAEGESLLAAWIDRMERFDRAVWGLKRLRVLGKGGDAVEFHPEFWYLDPSKIVISGRGAGLTGPALMAALRERFGLELEMAAGDYAIAMSGLCDTDEGMERLVQALWTLEREAERADLPPLPERRLPERLPVPRWAAPAADCLRAQREWLSPRQAVGRVSAEYVWAYPPGIPVLTPGEQVGEEQAGQLEWLASCGVNLKSTSGRAGLLAVVK